GGTRREGTEARRPRWAGRGGGGGGLRPPGKKCTPPAPWAAAARRSGGALRPPAHLPICATLVAMKTPESDLPAIEAEARRVASSAKGLADSLGQALPRLREDLRAVRAEAETLRAALQEEKRSREARQPP